MIKTYCEEANVYLPNLYSQRKQGRKRLGLDIN